MSTINSGSGKKSRFFWRVLCIIAGGFQLTGWGANSAVVWPEQLNLCRSNLARLFLALQEYRTNNLKLPKHLSDLVPKYLPDASFLDCPAWRTRSAMLSSSGPYAGTYQYEFEETQLTNEVARGLGITLRSWRQLEMGRIGSELPMVRCTNHAPVLNLSFGGDITDSGSEWDSNFTAVVRPEELSLSFLLSQYSRLKVVRIPERKSSLPLELVDLTRYYNGSLSGWMESPEDKGLGAFVTDPLVVDGISFDVRGVIQLGARNLVMPDWPSMATNIALGLRCAGLAFLQGTVSEETEGQEVGRYVVHLEDGSATVLPITYGSQVRDWKESNPDAIDSLSDRQKGQPSRKTSVVWKGGKRLFVFYWPNPHPNLRIECIDFVSAMARSAPFLVAVSVMRSSHFEETRER